jgi:hypothetical protein
MKGERAAEFEKPKANYDAEAIKAFAIETYRSRLFATGISQLTYAEEVCQGAWRLAWAFYADEEYDLSEQLYWSSVCETSGLLYDVLLLGRTFEDVIDVADEGVARTVAALTQDPRLPEPKRLEMYANQVGLAGRPTQLVKLCLLGRSAPHVIKVAEGSPGGYDLGKIDSWLREVRLVIPVLSDVRGPTTSATFDGVDAAVGRIEDLLLRPKKRLRRKA